MEVGNQQDKATIIAMLDEFHELVEEVIDFANDHEVWLISQMLERLQQLAASASKEHSEERRFWFTGEMYFARSHLDMLHVHFRRLGQDERVPGAPRIPRPEVRRRRGPALHVEDDEIVERQREEVNSHDEDNDDDTVEMDQNQ